MMYELTEEQHNNRALIRYLGYLCGQYPKKYFMRMRFKDNFIVYQLWYWYKDFHGFWDSRQTTEFKIENKPNEFKWKWLK